MTQFTSKTGQTYEVVPTNKNGWFRYEIIKDGRRVQFALTEDRIAEQVDWYENPGPDVGSRFD